MFTNSCSKLVWRVEDGLYGVIPLYLECLGILEAKKSGGSRMVWSGLWCERFVS